MTICALSMPDIILELPFIDLSVGPGELAPSILDIIEILSLKLISISGDKLTHTLSFSFHELSLVSVTVFPFVDTFSLKFAIFEAAHVTVPIDQLFDSVSVFDVFYNLAFIKQPLFRQNYSISSLLSSYKVTDIFVIFFVDMLSITVGFTLRPLSFIGHELFRAFGARGKNFDRSFSMLDSVFELS
jgi:hypothetical protein